MNGPATAETGVESVHQRVSNWRDATASFVAWPTCPDCGEMRMISRVDPASYECIVCSTVFSTPAVGVR